MSFETTPASNYSLSDLIAILNRGFEEYFVPIQFNMTAFTNVLRKDGIDLAASKVLTVDGQPCGIALLARRGWTSRLAAMGLAKESRGRGAGSWFLEELIREAGERGEREIVLEVIEQNEPAVNLYRKHGFEPIRRLIGCVRADADQGESTDLQEMDLREVGRLVSRHGLPDLPWQLSGESIAQMNPPARAYRSGAACIAISNPDIDQVVIWSLLVEGHARGKGVGSELLKAVIAHHPGKRWHMP
ncbi:MAG: GNAT family N-acetyltransferase, partial [Chloroflexota bacterium]|nr:GNAT family N-acetyltransferase [Chloroflexota bacterium]